MQCGRRAGRGATGAARVCAERAACGRRRPGAAL